MRKLLVIITILICNMSLHATDWSDTKAISIPEPVYATVNITGITAMPTTKDANYQAWLEYNDNQGNTFRKRVILNAQGNSSLTFKKKNFSIDFCEDEWVGDVVTDVTIGNWVKQDGFHLKAYTPERFCGLGVVAYHLYDKITETLPTDINRPWKRAGIEGNDNQICHPDGFPIILNLNGMFYGTYVWQLKKHRKNMNQEKDNPLHIHIDGNMWEETLFGGNVVWDEFEIRNPKKVTDPTCDAITALSKYDGELKELQSSGYSNAELRNEIEKRFDVTGMIDYYIFSLAVNNYDGFMKNWQWFTYDGVKWFVAPYDLDGTFGVIWTGNSIMPARYSFFDDDFTMEKEYVSLGPMKWITAYYMDDIKARYAELRKTGILNEENILHDIYEWYGRIDDEFHHKDANKWIYEVNVKTIPNQEWDVSNDYTDFLSLPLYDQTATYHAGDRVVIDYGRNISVWEANTTVSGVFPFQNYGHYYSDEELTDWIDERMALVDGYLGYDGHRFYDQSITVDIENSTTKNFISNVTYGLTTPSEIKDFCYDFDRTWCCREDDRPRPAKVFHPLTKGNDWRVMLYDTVTETQRTIAIDNMSAMTYIYNLIPGHTYRYNVTDGNSIIANGTIEVNGRVRMINVPSVFNVRDMGGWETTDGYRVKYGLMYRGSELLGGKYNNALQRDIDELKELGIKAELDLRSYKNVKTYDTNGYNYATANGAETSAFGEDYPYGWINMYDYQENVLRSNSDRVKKSFNFILDCLKQDKPIYMHCTYGADRTGIMSALLLGVMGVSISDIFKDYELTSLNAFSGKRDKADMKIRLYDVIGYTDEKASLEQACRQYMVKTIKISEKDINDFVYIMTGKKAGAIDGITEINTDADNGVAYGIDGIRRNTACRGISIIRRADNSVIKVIK